MKTLKNQTAYFNYIQPLTIHIDIVNACSHSGSCDNDINESILLPKIKKQLDAINKDQLIKELTGYGAWDVEELQDHEENLKRILWIACGNIQDELFN